MKIALIMENSQAAKNELVYNTLKNTVEPLGHTVDNYGMKGSDDKSLTYVQNGLLAAILLNSGAADFVVTGCGTGMGAMLALNSFPRVSCGLIIAENYSTFSIIDYINEIERIDKRLDTRLNIIPKY